MVCLFCRLTLASPHQSGYLHARTHTTCSCVVLQSALSGNTLSDFLKKQIIARPNLKVQKASEARIPICQVVSTERFLRPMEKVSDLHCIPKARTAAELFLAGGQSFHRRRSKTIGPLLKDSRGTSQCKSIPPRYSELFADQALQSCIEDSMRAFSSASTPSLSNYIGSE